MSNPSTRDTLLSVIVPAHNEADNLKVLLPRLFQSLFGMHRDFEILIVDNASTDQTPEVLSEFQKTIPQLRVVREPVLGYGRAVLSGLKGARGAVLGIIRADNQEKSEDLCRIAIALEESGFAMYKAVRKNRKSDGLKRVIISFFFNTLFTWGFGLHSRDLNATPKVVTRAFYHAAHLRSTDWFIDAEMVIKAEKMGYPIGEMEIEYLPRLKGSSNVRLRHIFEFLGNMLQWRLRLYHGKLLEE